MDCAPYGLIKIGKIIDGCQESPVAEQACHKEDQKVNKNYRDQPMSVNYTYHTSSVFIEFFEISDYLRNINGFR